MPSSRAAGDVEGWGREERRGDEGGLDESGKATSPVGHKNNNTMAHFAPWRARSSKDKKCTQEPKSGVKGSSVARGNTV